jgi:hypothetical protein
MKKVTPTIVLLFLCLPSLLAVGEAVVARAEGFERYQVVESKDFHSFTWDGHGSLGVFSTPFERTI